MNALFGRQLPDVAVDPPGPRSRELGGRLRRVESRNITHLATDWPIFWEAASGANVRDADGNVYVDLTGGFGVAAAGHAQPAVANAIAQQSVKLPHGLGDVHPSRVKVELLERLAAIAPADLDVSILGTTGADAVEAALKTAVLATGRAGVVAFRNGYHGLSIGTLAVTDRTISSAPFAQRLGVRAHLADYPDANVDANAEGTIRQVGSLIDDAAATDAPIGAVLVEPIQGRGGIIVPPGDFLTGLRALCDARGLLLIADEIYTGLGRTGRWFACDHAEAVPDVITVGKALSGSVPISAAIGRPEVMEAWPESTGEALHTSTFLGNPVGCAAALAQLRAIDELGLLDRATELGERVAHRTAEWVNAVPAVAATRGIGMLRGVVLHEPADEGARGDPLVKRLLRRGILALTEGPNGDVLALTPPLVIEEEQLDHALDVIEDELRR